MTSPLYSQQRTLQGTFAAATSSSRRPDGKIKPKTAWKSPAREKKVVFSCKSQGQVKQRPLSNKGIQSLPQKQKKTQQFEKQNWKTQTSRLTREGVSLK